MRLSRRHLAQKVYECVGGPLNMKGTGRSISHEMLMTVASFSNEPMRIHCLQGYISSLYLVQYPERKEWLLLDAGMPSDVERVQSFIAHHNKLDATTISTGDADKNVEEHGATSSGELVGGSSPKNPKLVVSTHCHIDHIGAGHRWAKRGVPVAAASDYAPYYAGVGGKIQEVVDTCLSLLVAFRLGRRFESPFSAFFRKSLTSNAPAMRPLDDGHYLPYFDDWVALKCPGHTDHMVVMYHPLTQILYVADFFVAPRRLRFQAPMPIDIEFAYSHSIHRLRKLPVRFALLAHGGIIDVEGIAGGWDEILNAVVVSQQKKSRKAAFRIIDAFTGFTPSPKRYTRDRLPRGPLPDAVAAPPPVTYLK